jgi:hypothetical protein
VPPDLHVEPFTGFRVELLGVVETRKNATRREDDRAGDDRPGQRAASCFIDSGNEGIAAAPDFPLEPVQE